MNNYITLDGNKYATLAKTWKPLTVKPSTDRLTLQGNIDVSYGPGVVKEWQGTIVADVSQRATGWGTVTTLKATLEKRESVSFTDHNGTTYTVHVLGTFDERSLTNVWDDSQNKIHFNVRILSE
jgi:hypothetical protein